MNCKRCGNQINGLWNEWELCDKCGYRYHVGAQRSPDGDCQPIAQQINGGAKPKKIEYQ